MREIKFRGLDKYGIWVFGSLVNNLWAKDKGTTPICEIVTTDRNYYDCWEDMIDNENIVEVDYKTVGQYTGLKDKNGNPIYEGDVLVVWGGDKLDDNQYKTDIVRIVEYDNYELGYTINTPNGDECKLTSGNIYQLEVIGNIYEHPHLLENKIEK